MKPFFREGIKARNVSVIMTRMKKTGFSVERLVGSTKG
jgi:hypothetical protein